MTIDEFKEKFINKELEVGLFTSNDNKVIRIFDNGFSISTYQDNGWTRINIYEYIDEVWCESETYER